LLKKQTEKLNSGAEESKSSNEPQKAIITLKPQKGKDILENASPAIKARFNKMVNKAAEENKSNEPEKTIKLDPNTPPPKKASQLAQEYLEKVGKPRSNPSTPVTITRKQLEYKEDDDEGGGYDSDKTDVLGEIITVADNLKPIYIKAQKYLVSTELKDLKNSVNLKDTNIKAYDKLNKFLAQITGKPSEIKKIGTLRKKLLVQFKT